MGADAARDPALLKAAHAALQHFPVSPKTVQAFSVSENITYRVVDEDSRHYALRLHRPGYNDLSQLTAERQWVEALGEQGIRTQRGVLAATGDAFVAVDIPGSTERRFCGLTTWLPGEALSRRLEAGFTAEERQSCFRAIGELAATLHNQACRWSPPPDFDRPRLDCDGLLGETPRWGRFWDHRLLDATQRSALLHARGALREFLDGQEQTAAHFSLIHADLHADNLLLSNRRLGIIDFDDCAFGWHLYDLASALVEHQADADFEALKAALLEGYRKLRPLPDSEWAKLPQFLLLRGLALIGWYHQRPEHPESAFFAGVLAQVLRGCATLR